MLVDCVTCSSFFIPLLSSDSVLYCLLLYRGSEIMLLLFRHSVTETRVHSNHLPWFLHGGFFECPQFDLGCSECSRFKPLGSIRSGRCRVKVQGSHLNLAGAGKRSDRICVPHKSTKVIGCPFCSPLSVEHLLLSPSIVGKRRESSSSAFCCRKSACSPSICFPCLPRDKMTSKEKK